MHNLEEKRMIRNYFASLVIALVATVGVIAPTSVHAAGVFDEACKNSTSVVCQQKNGADGKINGFVEDLVRILFFAIGIIAVIMIIIGGIKYVTSNGDSAQVTSAKNTVLYSVVGLVVAVLAFAIVNFVLEQFR